MRQTGLPIILRPEALRLDHVPLSLPGRSDEAHELLQAVKESRNTVIIGPHGVGKTALARSVEREARLDRRIGVFPVYVSCADRAARGQYNIVLSVRQQLGLRPRPRRDVNYIDLLDLTTRETLGRIWLILDDLPALLADWRYKKPAGPFISWLLKNKVTLTLVSTGKDYEGLPSYKDGRLDPVIIELKPYGVEDLEAIVMLRAEEALERGAIREEGVALIARRASNVTEALSILGSGASLAEAQGSQSIDVSHLEAAAAKSAGQHLILRIEELDRHAKVTLAALAELQTSGIKPSTGQLYSSYRSTCQQAGLHSMSRTHHSERVMPQLLVGGIVEAKARRGARGRTRIISLHSTLQADELLGILRSRSQIL